MREKYNIVLSIAGSDSSAGAGIQADMKSVAACGAYCATAITAITAQNTVGVDAVDIVSDEMVRAQISAVIRDLDVTAIKLGMLPSSGIVNEVHSAICSSGIKNIVLDPVMISTSGAMLVSNEVAKLIIDRLLPLTTVATPNIPECEFITGLEVKSVSDFELVADYFKERGCKSLLIKSGHLSDGDISDYLYDFTTGERHIFRFERIESKNTHGTGCSLSSSIAAYLSQGYSLAESIGKAEEYIHCAIESAGYVIGKGFGPINHFCK